MKNTPIYRSSLLLTVLLTVMAFLTLLSWLGSLINGIGSQPLLSLIPWPSLGLLILAGINCSIRARLILKRAQSDGE